VNAPDVWAAIEYAYANEEVFADARTRFAVAAQNLFAEHTVELSASSAGKCALDVWAYLHDLYDLPDNTATKLAKMDGGTLYGAWIAALFGAAYEATAFCRVTVEVTGEHDGIPAHVEIIIASEHGEGNWVNDWVIEIKTSFSTFDFTQPPEYHVIQAAKEALVAKVPGFSIYTNLPAAQKRKGADAKHHFQHDYITAEWESAVAVEYARLRTATLDTPPPADPKEAWRCSSCRYSVCERNPKHNALEEILT
jgi:hypothetical protein